jgi:hypothetical protein
MLTSKINSRLEENFACIEFSQKYYYVNSEVTET